jgi:hypothetical protein
MVVIITATDMTGRGCNNKDGEKTGVSQQSASRGDATGRLIQRFFNEETMTRTKDCNNKEDECECGMYRRRDVSEELKVLEKH